MSIIRRNEREVSIFRNGRSRAVRIPKEFDFDGDKALMSMDPDGTLHLRPKPKRMTPAELLDWLASQGPIDEDWPEVTDYPPEPVDLGFEE